MKSQIQVMKSLSQSNLDPNSSTTSSTLSSKVNLLFSLYLELNTSRSFCGTIHFLNLRDYFQVQPSHLYMFLSSFWWHQFPPLLYYTQHRGKSMKRRKRSQNCILDDFLRRLCLTALMLARILPLPSSCWMFLKILLLVGFLWDQANKCTHTHTHTSIFR